MKLTNEEINLISNNLPFFDMPEGQERIDAIGSFIKDAQRLYFLGAEDFIDEITALDDNGKEVKVIFEKGDYSVGICDMWVVDGELK